MENVSNITKPKIDILSLILSTVAFGGIVYALATLAELPLSDWLVWGLLQQAYLP